MDHLIPPLQNLTIADPPTRKLSQQKSFSFNQLRLNQFLRQLYGPSKTSCSSMLRNAKTSKRINEVRVRALERVACGECVNCLRKEISRVLREMARSRPEQREKLLLVNLYVQQRKNKGEVLSIVKSLY